MMSRRLMPLILALMLASPALAQAAATAPAAEELTQLLKEFLDGASRNEVAAHNRFWADDLIYTRSSGVRTGKAEILENAGSGATAAGPTEYSAEDIRIQQYGDTAVVAFRLVGRTGSGPQAVVEHFLNTGTFVKRNGEWRVVAWQSTREAPGAKASATSREHRDHAADIEGLIGPSPDRRELIPFRQGKMAQ